MFNECNEYLILLFNDGWHISKNLCFHKYACFMKSCFTVCDSMELPGY